MNRLFKLEGWEGKWKGEFFAYSKAQFIVYDLNKKSGMYWSSEMRGFTELTSYWEWSMIEHETGLMTLDRRKVKKPKWK